MPTTNTEQRNDKLVFRAPSLFPVFDRGECNSIVNEVDAVRADWVRRHPVLPFFTLGAASYMDAAMGRALYIQRAAQYNPILQEHFGWALERVRECISRAIGLSAEWHPGAALPGFHIYSAHPEFTRPIASIHFDKQYELLDWQGLSEPDFAHPLSFTLAFVLPLSGGGLNVWDADCRFVPPQMKISELISNRAPAYHRYTPGELVLHSGNFLHQIAPTNRFDPEDRRITLQGHGIKAGNYLYLYW
jgi:hypothetical protein